PEKITGPRAGVDLVAQVARGKKETAKLEVTAAKDAEPGIHKFRIQTPLGTSNMAVIAIGSLPEIQTHKSSGTEAQRVELPATLVGTIGTPGERHNYSFEGKAGEEVVFQVVGSQLGSKLQSLLVLRDSSGKQLADAGQMKTARMPCSVSNCRRK